jgi:DNA polymerase-3 subunit epsilon
MSEQVVTSTGFTAIDFETTGLYPATDKIIECGAVMFTDQHVEDTFQALVNPGIPIGEDAARISGITDRDVAGSPPAEEVIPRLLSFLGSTVLVAHNAPFDIGFLRAACETLGLPPVDNRVVDTLALAMKAFPRRRSYGLQNLAADLALAPNQAHRALDDAMTCMKLFQKCVEQLSFMGDLPLSEVLTEGS